ncbi:T9SS type A sorting domain-containing protein [Psychroflexus salis]|uniref:Secretion system C-terminal sorting domain-containing protein n=1 Tax=Psychroflexus salis TaxID=1526574 RepID=A0A917E891_9FLAO|nr:T9SS type A sorting domain-containing protein [Psychroflexus salis]GGE12999.1 hypothetical protein GCM10010831_13060 [Psychroflexus salis]
MKKSLLSISFLFAFMFFGYGQTFTTIAQDNASNYGGGWTNGSNEGVGFANWDFLTAEGTAGFFIGNSTQNSRQSINTGSGQAFAMFTDGGNAFARRAFDHNDDNELKIGEKFIFEVSFSWSGGRRGIDVWANDNYTDFLLNIEHQGNDRLTIFPSSAGSTRVDLTPNEFNQAWRIEMTWNGGVTDNLLVKAFKVSNNQEVGSELLSVSSPPKSFTLLYTDGPTDTNKSNFEPYFNNFKIERPTFTTIADGNFSDSTIWNDGIVPVGNGNITLAHDINLDTNLSLNGELSINTGNTLSVNDNVVLTNNGSITIDGDLVFKSTATSTAQYGNSSGTITGDVTVERFIPAKRAFRVLSSAVGGQSFANAWQQDTHITGTDGATNGFDTTNLNTPSLFTFDNSVDPQTGGAGWQAVTSTTSTNIVAGTPYRLFVRGDRSVALNSNTSPATVTTLSAAGDMHTGSFSPSLATAANNYSFVGNPYQAVVDINATTRTNLTDFIYVWDASIAGDNGNGGFVTVPIPGSATPNPFSSDATQYVAPGQAFFVQNTASGNGSITFEEADKETAQTQQTPFSVNNEFYINSRLYKTSALNNNETESDAIGLRFNENYTTLGSDEDAGKLGNPGENYIIINNGLKAIDFQNIPTNGHVIELGLVNYEDNEYSLTFDLDHKPENLKVYLNDTYLATQTEIIAELNYNFTVDASISETVDPFRFNISFEEVSLLNLDFTKTDFSIFPNPTDDVLHINFTENLTEAVDISIFNLIGKKVVEFTHDASANQLNFSVQDLTSGVYLLKIQNKEMNLTKKFIKQ